MVEFDICGGPSQKELGDAISQKGRVEFKTTGYEGNEQPLMLIEIQETKHRSHDDLELYGKFGLGSEDTPFTMRVEYNAATRSGKATPLQYASARG